MENIFYKELNKNTIEAVKQNRAFFMNPRDLYIPPINNSYTGTPITGANYFNLKLSNDLSGKGHTEYVKVNEVLSSNIDWLSTLPRENRPRGTLYQEGSATSNAGYSFVMPTAELNQNIYRDNRDAAPANNYVPFQSNNAAMDNFNEFVHEQFANAINASLTKSTFKSNINEHEMGTLKTKLINEIAKNPSFMAEMANRACEEVMNFHDIPLDKDNFVKKTRKKNSPEFTQLNSAITDHVKDIYYSKKSSFNPEFNELSRPLVMKIESLHMGNNPEPAVNREITEFLRKQIRQDKAATILADVFAGTFVEKAIKLVRTGKRIFAGIMLAGAIFKNPDASHDPIINFCRDTSNKMGGADVSHSRLDDFVKVAGNIMTSQELKGDRSLKTYRDQNNPRSFYTKLNQLIRDNPQMLEQAIAQIDNSKQHRTQSAERGQAMRR